MSYARDEFEFRCGPGMSHNRVEGGNPSYWGNNWSRSLDGGQTWSSWDGPPTTSGPSLPIQVALDDLEQQVEQRRAEEILEDAQADELITRIGELRAQQNDGEPVAWADVDSLAAQLERQSDGAAGCAAVLEAVDNAGGGTAADHAARRRAALCQRLRDIERPLLLAARDQLAEKLAAAGGTSGPSE